MIKREYDVDIAREIGVEAAAILKYMLEKGTPVIDEDEIFEKVGVMHDFYVGAMDKATRAYIIVRGCE